MEGIVNESGSISTACFVFSQSSWKELKKNVQAYMHDANRERLRCGRGIEWNIRVLHVGVTSIVALFLHAHPKSARMSAHFPPLALVHCRHIVASYRCFHL